MSTGGPYGAPTGYNGNVPLGNYASGQAYGVQVRISAMYWPLIISAV